MKADLCELLRLRLVRHATDVPHVVAVSGGVDSVVLFDVLRRLGFARLTVAHFNHRLRGADADADEALVRALAAEVGCACAVRAAGVAEEARQAGESVETCGRRLRLAFFAEVAAWHGARTVFLGHHGDDQAETVLLHLLRGAGLNGLGGMREEAPAEGVTLLRPLLAVSRRDILAHAEAHGLSWREDASNATSGPLRNRLRHEALPLLSSLTGREVGVSLQRFARLAAEDDAWMAQEAKGVLDRMRDGAAGLPVKPLRQCPLALRRRLLRLWLRDHGVPGLGFEHIEDGLAVLAADAEPSKVNLPGNWRLRRRAGRLFLDRP